MHSFTIAGQVKTWFDLPFHMIFRSRKLGDRMTYLRSGRLLIYRCCWTTCIGLPFISAVLLLIHSICFPYQFAAVSWNDTKTDVPRATLAVAQYRFWVMYGPEVEPTSFTDLQAEAEELYPEIAGELSNALESAKAAPDPEVRPKIFSQWYDSTGDIITTAPSYLGGFSHTVLNDWQGKWVQTYYTCPSLFLAVVLSAPGAIWFIRWRRRRLTEFRRKGGLCLNCGYDLRGSPDRCPECGKEMGGKEKGSLQSRSGKIEGDITDFMPYEVEENTVYK